VEVLSSEVHLLNRGGRLPLKTVCLH
jgi:hypothetical protein